MDNFDAYDLEPTRNVIEVTCKLAGRTFEFYHRLPSNAERTKYDNSMTVRKGNRVVVSKDYQLIQAKFGAGLLTGFKKGQLQVGGKIIASEPGDPDYYADWKTHLYKRRPDLLAHVARTIMSPVAAPESGVEFETGDETIEDLENPDFTFDESADQVEGAAPVEETKPSPLGQQ